MEKGETSYCLYVKFNDPVVLHNAHKNIKSLDFVVGEISNNLEDAHSIAVKYINNFFNNSNESVNWVTELPATPNSNAEWCLLPFGYSCSEKPCEWELTVWNKQRTNGYLFNSFKIEEIIVIKILQMKKICLDSPIKKWYCNDIYNNGSHKSDSESNSVQDESDVSA